MLIKKLFNLIINIKYINYYNICFKFIRELIYFFQSL